MEDLARVWTDPDRRHDALLRLGARVALQPEHREHLTPRELEVVRAMSVGLGREGTADVLGISVESVKEDLTRARRALRAKTVGSIPSGHVQPLRRTKVRS